MPIILDGTTGITTPGITNTGEFVFQGPIQVPAGSAASASVTTAAGPDTGLYFPSSSSIAITTAGTEKVSVGTGLVINDGGADFDTRIEGDTDANLFFVDASTDRIGVGTDTPLGKLHITTGSGNTEVYQNVTGTGTASRTVYSRGGAIQFYAGLGAWTGNDTYEIAGASGPLTTLTTSGNLGLGVTPSTWNAIIPLEIGFAGNAFGGFGGDAGVYITTAARYETNWKYAVSGKAATLYSAEAGAHKWSTAPSGTAGNTISFGTAMTLDASGNLGVGTASPAAKLDVRGSNPYMYIVDSGANLAAFVAEATNTVVNVGSTYLGTSAVPLALVTGGSERARITAGGDLLVNSTTSLNTKLLVEGQAAIGSAGAGGNGIYLYVNGALADNSYLSRSSAGSGTTTWYIGNQTITTSSDSRLKANIKPTERNALELLNQWEIVDHTWNDPSDQCENNRNSRGVWTGVVAQQVQPITPWLVNKPLEEVNEDGTINPWTMDFGYAVPLLVKAIQEQQAMIEDLKAKVAALEAK